LYKCQQNVFVFVFWKNKYLLKSVTSYVQLLLSRFAKVFNVKSGRQNSIQILNIVKVMISKEEIPG